jgi:hypothetical protein
MDIKQELFKLLSKKELFKYKQYIIDALIAIFLFFSLLPTLINSIVYFTPLFISTAVFVALVTIFTNTTPPNNDPVPIPKPLKEIIDYIVAGYNYHLHHPDDNHDHLELPAPHEKANELPPHSKTILPLLICLNSLITSS